MHHGKLQMGLGGLSRACRSAHAFWSTERIEASTPASSSARAAVVVCTQVEKGELSGLHHLERLELGIVERPPWDFEESVLNLASPPCLPLSITHLSLRDCKLYGLPEAVVALTQASTPCSDTISQSLFFVLSSTAGIGPGMQCAAASTMLRYCAGALLCCDVLCCIVAHSSSFSQLRSLDLSDNPPPMLGMSLHWLEELEGLLQLRTLNLSHCGLANVRKRY